MGCLLRRLYLQQLEFCADGLQAVPTPTTKVHVGHAKLQQKINGGAASVFQVLLCTDSVVDSLKIRELGNKQRYINKRLQGST